MKDEPNWEVTDRLHGRGLIHDPKSKAKSVVLGEGGFEKEKAAFEKLFGNPDEGSASTHDSL